MSATAAQYTTHVRRLDVPHHAANWLLNKVRYCLAKILEPMSNSRIDPETYDFKGVCKPTEPNEKISAVSKPKETQQLPDEDSAMVSEHP
jgi:hypothetical protein